MGQDSKIEWTTHTFNHVRGCTRVSEGCRHCYAETMSKRNPGTLGVWGPNGTRVVASESKWREPLKWDREAKAVGERHRVFCASLADVFEDWQGPMVDSKGKTLWVDQVGRWRPESLDFPFPEDQCRGAQHLTMDDVRVRLFDLIRSTPNLDWLLLTKRPDNIGPTLRRVADGCEDRPASEAWQRLRSIVSWLNGNPPENVWLGVSAESQAMADERIPILLSIPAAVRFVSAEPLLSAIDLSEFLGLTSYFGPVTGAKHWSPRKTSPYWGDELGLHWVIVGGESAPDSRRRPMQLEWLESIAGQCEAANVPLYVKQDSATRDGQQGRIPDRLWSIKQFPTPHAIGA